MITAVFILEVFAFQSQINIKVPLIELNAGLTEFVIWSLTFIELKSIDENFKDAKGKTLVSKVTGIFKYIRTIIAGVKGKAEDS